VDSRLSSRRAHLSLIAAVVLVGSACVTVRPQDKELLADPAMTYGKGGAAHAHEEHVLSNREGSAGAGQTVGGGCGCN